MCGRGIIFNQTIQYWMPLSGLMVYVDASPPLFIHWFTDDNLAQTTAHGPNWIEYFTECYEGLPQDCETQLFDVAYGGASVDSDLVPPAYTHIVDFIHQVKQWKEYIKPAVTWKPETTLTAVWFG